MVWCEEMQSSALLTIVTGEISRTVVKGTGAILKSHFYGAKEDKTVFSETICIQESLLFALKSLSRSSGISL